MKPLTRAALAVAFVASLVAMAAFAWVVIDLLSR